MKRAFFSHQPPRALRAAGSPGRSRRASRAFTYIELSTVVLIIAILAAIAVPNFLEARTRAVVARSRADMALTKMGIEAYRLETRAYPLNAQAGQWGPADLTCLTTPVAYLAVLPNDPFTIEEVVGARGVPHRPPEPYHYLNGVQVNAEEGLSVFANGQRVGGWAAALLWGYSSADALAVKGAPVSVRIEPGAKVQLVNYDPTNGTVSIGDLYTILP